MLFTLMREKGCVPVLLSDVRNPPQDDRLYGYLERCFEKQYEGTDVEEYRQLDRMRRVVIVDDFHKMSLPARAKLPFIKRLVHFAGAVIVFSHDLDISMLQVLGEAFPSSSVHRQQPTFYRILPLGYRLRDELTERWLTLGTFQEEGAELARHVVNVNRLLNTIIGKNYVPPYPIYVLSVLQAQEAATPIDPNKARTHGYFYEVLIKVAIGRNATPSDYDITSGFLAYLAYSFFQMQVQRVPETTLEEIHNRYRDIYDVARTFAAMKDQLTELHLLKQSSDGSFRFRYQFIYYYFVAAYMRDHISDDLVRAKVTLMASTLHVDECASIMLFLSHLSKDPYIVL